MQRAADHGVPTLNTTPMPKSQGTSRKARGTLVRTRDWDVFLENVFYVQQGSSTLEISATQLPKEDLNNVNTKIHANVDVELSQAHP